jgi:hypothetical protein
MYRLKNGRFEQIGMSWLKHGFCAADASGENCGSCASNPSCDWLGLGCTDTYDAGLNGAQSGLGPRSDINPTTGVFPYPYTIAWQQTGNAIYKRTQVNNDDLNPAMNPGAIYLAEVQYVCTDENTNGFNNTYNNVSWKQVTVGALSGGGYNLSFTTGTTHTQQAAIQGWNSFDSNAKTVDHLVPNEGGKFIIGYTTTSLGGGQYRYEFAVYNMNSYRGAASFSVPVPMGAVVTNVGFHDVNYHSGELFDNTDWSSTVGSTSVMWTSPQTFVQNPNTNALRWSTTYNFRFDCNVPPVKGDVSLGYFRTGSPSSSAISAAIPRPCACLTDMNANGAIDAEDISLFVRSYTGADPYSICADIAAPSGAPLTAADLAGFVSALVNGGCL